MSLCQFAFWDTEPELNADFRESLRYFYRQLALAVGDTLPLLWDSDIDRLLCSASERTEPEWICVLGVGLIFPEPKHFADLVLQTIGNISSPTLVAGQLLNKHPRYCGLHQQTFFVNLKTYRDLGRPRFGNYEKQNLVLQNYDATESIHDDYTPKFLHPRAGTDLYETWTCGWNFIHVSLQAGLSISNLPDDLRSDKIYAYPDDDLQRLNKNLRLLYEMEDMENSTQRKVLGYLFNRKFGFNPSTRGSLVNLSDRRDPVSFFEPVVWEPPYSDWLARDRRPIKAYLGVCAPLLEAQSLFMHGFQSDTRMIFFDANPKVLELQKRVLDQFDGNLDDWESFRRSLWSSGDFPYQPGADVARLTKTFGSKEAFTQVWQQIRRLPQDFVNLSPVSNAPALLRMAGDGRILFSIGSSFAGSTGLTYGFSETQRRFGEFVSTCARFPDLVLSGQNIHGQTFTGFARDL